MRRSDRVARLGLRTLFLITPLAGCTIAWADEAGRLAEALRLRPGSIVADVGAGDGEWSEELARRVGQGGHLFATEVKGDLVAEIRERLEKAGLANFTVVEGDQESSGLREACCDAILLRMVYHHFERPESMRSDLWRALRPGGRIAIVDIVPQKHWRELDDVPDRGGHGIPIDDLAAEMAGDGFEPVGRHDRWNGDEDRFCLVFRKPAGSEAPSGPG